MAWASSNTTTPSKCTAEPVDDLLNAAGFLAPCLGAQGRVGGEEDAFVERDRSALAEARQRHDVGAVAADRGPVALGILDQLVGFGDPAPRARRAALEPVVENDRGDLAALAGAGAVAEEPAAPETHRAFGAFRGGRDDVVGVVDGVGPGEMAGMRLAGIDRRSRAARRTGCRPRAGAAADAAGRTGAAGRPRPWRPTARAWSDAAARRESGSPAAHSPRRGSR